MDEQKEALVPVTLFYSYARKDEQLRDELEKHLSLLQRQGLITTWHARLISPGIDTAQVIDTYLTAASIILLLISPDFLASDYCYGVEMLRALERQKNGESYVIPVLLRPVDWQSAPFEHLQGLPRSGKPVTSWPDQDEAFRDVARGIRLVVEHMHEASDTKPLLPLPAWVVNQQISPVSRTNRERMFKRMRATWIDGVLEHSLHHATLLELGLQEQPDAVANPWHLTVQETKFSSRLLPASTRITHVFDEAAGELLILGEPGSGKTTLLLELTRHLLERAEQDETYPIPVVFNLSSWAEKHQSLAEWLVQELFVKYQVPRRLAQMWVDGDQVLTLLDGLDEVVPRARQACLSAINAYHQAHGLMPLVVCSRSEEYEKLTKRLKLQYAVTIQPLTRQQVEDYLARGGESLVVLREAWRKDSVLEEIAKTPLMLDVMALAYQNGSSESLPDKGSLQERKQQIFDTYVKRMLERRSESRHYNESQVHHWLTWLAGQLAHRGQQEFYLEQMHLNWLPAVQISSAEEVMAWSTGLFYGLLNSLSMLLGFGIFYGWSSTGGNLIVGVSSLSFGMIGLCIGYFTIKNSDWEKIFTLPEVISWSGSDWRYNLWESWQRTGSCRLMFFAGLPGAALAGLHSAAQKIPQWLIDVWIVCGFVIGIFIVRCYGSFYFTFVNGWSSSLLEDKKRLTPNEGIWRSARNSLLVALVEVIFNALGLVPLIILVNSVWNGRVAASIWLIVAIDLAAQAALRAGGIACMTHLVIRLFLQRLNSIPSRYVQFLDYATERILLRRVGGGYMFAHRLLLEYFAKSSIYTEEVSRSTFPSSASSDVARAGVVSKKSQDQHINKQAKHAQSSKRRTRH